jgi:carbon storage regulator CsrA
MLVLSRKKTQGITIETPDGTIIRVHLIDVRGDKVRLGFSADDGVLIARDELCEHGRPSLSRRRKAVPA